MFQKSHIRVLRLFVISITIFFCCSGQAKDQTMSVDCSYLRRLSSLDNGTSHLFLRNESDKTIQIIEVLLDDEPLPKQDYLEIDIDPISML